MIRARSERLVNSSKTGLSMRRRIASRARPGSAPAKISGIKERSERSRSRKRVLRLLLSLCWSRSQAEKIALRSSGLINSGQAERFLQSQKSISLVAECSRRLRSRAERSSASFPASEKTLRNAATSRALLPCMSWSARATQPSPSAAGKTCKTRLSLAEGSLSKIAPSRGSSSTIKRSSVRSGCDLCSFGTAWIRSSRPMTSSKASAGLSR